MHELSPEKSHKKPTSNFGKPVVVGVVAAIALGASFFGGVQFQKGKTPAIATNAMNGMNGQMQMGANGQMPGGSQMMMGGGGVFGEVTAINSASITIKDNGGGTTTLAINDSTTIRNGEEAAAADAIQAGDLVIAAKDTSDTSIAKQIIVNPTMPGSQGSAQGTSQQSADTTDTPTTYTN